MAETYTVLLSPQNDSMMLTFLILFPFVVLKVKKTVNFT